MPLVWCSGLRLSRNKRTAAAVNDFFEENSKLSFPFGGLDEFNLSTVPVVLVIADVPRHLGDDRSASSHAIRGYQSLLI
jgi:hypothetical protein